MTTEMTNEEMRVNIIVMSRLAEKGKLGYAIARNTRKMKDAAKEYIDIYDDLVKKYGKANSRGGVTVPKENEEAFNAEIAEVKDLSFDVELFKVDEDTFVNGTLTSGQMEQLLWMVQEGK